MDSVTNPPRTDVAAPATERSADLAAVLMRRRRPGPCRDRRAQRRHRRRVPGRDASRTPPPRRTASWPTCPATKAGSGPSSSRRIPVPTTPPSAKSCWCRGRPRCWRRSGCHGRSASGPVISAPATCWPRPPKTRAWCPASVAPATRRSTTSPPSSGLGRRRVLGELGPFRRRAALARRRLRSRLGDGQVHPAGMPGLRLLPAAVRIPRPMFGVCANELSADGHVVDAEYGCGAHSDTPALPEAAHRCTTRTTTASLTSSNRQRPAEEEPRASSEQPEPTDVSDPATE